MENKERRRVILQKLKSTDEAVTGRELAMDCQVSRQIIVSDIAMLRAEGEKILATSQGYILERQEDQKVEELKLISKDAADLRHELELIVDNGGVVTGAAVDYGPYGRLHCAILLNSRRDIRKWFEKLAELHFTPLSLLAGGAHSLYVEIDNAEEGEEIWQVLEEAGYLQDTENP